MDCFDKITHIAQILGIAPNLGQRTLFLSMRHFVALRRQNPVKYVFQIRIS